MNLHSRQSWVIHRISSQCRLLFPLPPPTHLLFLSSPLSEGFWSLFTKVARKCCLCVRAIASSCGIFSQPDRVAKANPSSNALAACAAEELQLLTMPAPLGCWVALPKLSSPFELSQAFQCRARLLARCLSISFYSTKHSTVFWHFIIVPRFPCRKGSDPIITAYNYFEILLLLLKYILKIFSHDYKRLDVCCLRNEKTLLLLYLLRN